MLHRPAFIAAILALAANAFAADFTPPKLPTEGVYPSGKIVKITDKGALPDGKTLCTDAIAQAIDECAAAGGGIVEIPSLPHDQSRPVDTIYLTGRIKLKSKITLQIDEGVTLKFSTDRSLYPLEKTRWECTDIMNYSPLIYAYQCQDIRITGKGTIDGQGQTWWTWMRGKNPQATLAPFTNDRQGKFPIEQRIFGEKVQGLRPTLIEPYECKHVLIENVTIRNSPFWTIHPVYSEDIILRNADIHGDGPNTDGIDPDSSRNLLIEKSTFATGDDCIVLKSGRDGDGIRVNKPTENVTIRNCTMKGGHGAVTIGSETSGSIRHVLAEDCTIDGPDSAIRIKSTRGRGGVIEDILFRRLTTNKTLKYAITIDMKYTNVPEAPKSETTPVFKDIHIEDFKCDNSPQAIWVVGLPESPIDGLTLKNIDIKADKGSHMEYVNNLSRDNVTVTPKSGQPWDMKQVTESK